MLKYDMADFWENNKGTMAFFIGHSAPNGNNEFWSSLNPNFFDTSFKISNRLSS